MRIDEKQDVKSPIRATHRITSYATFTSAYTFYQHISFTVSYNE